MIHVIITSFNEPKATFRAIEAFTSQKELTKESEIIVMDPFLEVEKFIKKNVKDKRVKFFLDPGEGKSYALNLIMEQKFSGNKDDIIISTDGDVYVSEESVKEIISAFKDERVGCVTGKPVSIDERRTKYGLWADIAFRGIDKVRERMSREEKFFECSGYLFAFRNGVISQFPLETSEDSIIPYLFWKKGYKIKYLPNAEVYVKNPSNWKDWITQKVRNIKAHENLNKIAPDMPRTKSLTNEIKEGALFAIKQPRSIKELFWIFELYFARIYIYFKAFRELRKKKSYSDGWRGENTTESTKTLD